MGEGDDIFFALDEELEAETDAEYMAATADDLKALNAEEPWNVTTLYVEFLRAEIMRMRADGADLEEYTKKKVIEFCARFDLDDIFEAAHERSMVDARIRVIVKRARFRIAAVGETVAVQTETEKLKKYKSNPNFGRF